MAPLRKLTCFEVVRACIPLSLMALVAFAQYAVVLLTDMEVWDTGVEDRLNVIETALESFFSSNGTLPDSEALCGAYAMHELRTGKHSHMTMPDGSIYGPTSDAFMYYARKLPSNTWEPERQGVERSVIDDALYVIHEGVSLNLWSPHLAGYSPVFLLMIALWIMTLLVEFRSIADFGLMVSHFTATPPIKDVIEMDPETGRFNVIGLTQNTRILGWVMFAFRLFVATKLLLVGTKMLLYTSLKMELILNSVALVFVLELDSIVYQAVVGQSRQHLLSNFDPISYKPAGSHKIHKASRAITPIIALGVVTASFFVAMAPSPYLSFSVL
jgi:hypothetical protein